MIPSPKHHWCLQTLPPGRVAFAFVWCNVRPTYSTNKIFIFIYILWKQMEAKLNSSSPRRKRHLFSCSCFSVHGYESQSTFWPPLDHSSVFIRHYPWSLQCASMGWQENLENRPSREENALPFWSPSLYSKKKKMLHSVWWISLEYVTTFTMGIIKNTLENQTRPWILQSQQCGLTQP